MWEGPAGSVGDPPKWAPRLNSSPERRPSPSLGHRPPLSRHPTQILSSWVRLCGAASGGLCGRSMAGAGVAEAPARGVVRISTNIGVSDAGFGGGPHKLGFVASARVASTAARRNPSLERPLPAEITNDPPVRTSSRLLVAPFVGRTQVSKLRTTQVSRQHLDGHTQAGFARKQTTSSLRNAQSS